MKIPDHIKPNRAEARAIAEGERFLKSINRPRSAGTATPGAAEPGSGLLVKHDPRAGVELILDRIGVTTLVAILPDCGSITGYWLDEATLPHAAAWAQGKNEAGFNVYFCPNLPRHGTSKKPAKADIESLRCCFADVDAKQGRSLEQALAVVTSLRLPPTLTIMSGGGWQPIWLLEQPVPASAEYVLRAEAIGKELAEMMQGDQVQNVDRILRLPFTKNYPTANKRAEGRVVCDSGILARASEE